MQDPKADKEQFKKWVRSQLDDPQSDLAKYKAEELSKLGIFNGVNCKGIKADAKVRIEGTDARVSDDTHYRDIHLVKEDDGWKRSHELVVGP